MFLEVSWSPRGSSSIPGVVWACPHGDCLFRAPSAEVAALGLLWQRSWPGLLHWRFHIHSWICRSLVLAYSFCGPRLMPGPAKVSGSALLPPRFQTHALTHRGSNSGLLPQRSQTHVWTKRGLWPTPSAIAPLYLLPWSSLSQACSHVCCWLRLVSVNVPDLGPLPWRSLVWIRSYKGPR